MRSIQLVAGACAAALFGALTGASIGTDPLERGANAWDHVPQPDFDGDSAALQDEPDGLPDHYPLVTPSGRIEVAELRNHGLYRNRRFAIDPYWDGYPEPDYELMAADYLYVPDEEPAPAARPAPSPAPATRLAAASQPQPQPKPTENEPVVRAASAKPIAPPPLAELPALAGGAKTIEVAAELGGRP
jgi:hypothetical protein